MAEFVKPSALFVGFESDEFNALVLEAARTHFDVVPMQGSVALEILRDRKWDAVVIAFSPEHVQSNTLQSIVASWPDSFYYFVYPKGVQQEDLATFIHGFLNHVTRRRKIGTIEYFIAESSEHAATAIAEASAPTIVMKDKDTLSPKEFGKGRPTLAIPDELSITFDPSLSAEQIEIALTALADYYRACGGAGLPAEFESEEAFVLEDANV